MDVIELRRKADLGDADAQHTLAHCYHSGQNGPQDYAEAAALFHRAADQGHLTAQCCLGLLYCDGTGVPHDDRDAARIFRRAANKEHAGAQFELGACYDFGKGRLRTTTKQRASTAARLSRGHAGA